MNLRTRLLASASALAIVAGFGLIGASQAGAVTTYAVGNDHATCNTLGGTIKFTSHLKNSGPTTGANTIKVALTLTGCFDDDKSAVKMFKGAAAVSLGTTNGWNCAGLLGPSSVSGATDLVWTAAAGQAFSPKITVGTVQKTASHVTFTQVSGGTFSVPPANAPWNAAYGFFAIGPNYGTAPLGISGDFTGGDSGSTGWFAGTTQQDIGYILTTCGTTAGVATLNFGIGAVHS
ncbi:MAG: hypothetical protein QOH10_1449 [Actinomycetota bacterium]|jgi:hypothetical protein|nr:hypothetical protein [Actinomycetota bacterium]